MVKPIVMLFSAVLLLVGIIGFVNDPVLGIFEVNTAHNLVHLLSGAVGLAMAARGPASARMFALLFGGVYALVAVLGFMTIDHAADHTLLLNLVEINGAGNYLHLVLAGVFLIVGIASPASASA
jgi:hypothetical protein